jgi:HlyD family secretion protein
MNIRKIILSLVICGVIIFSVSCAAKSDSTTATTQTATVKKGNIALDVTATGNLALAKTEDMAFEMAGTVDNVSVSAGDSVTEGQELVTLDTSDWEDQIKTLQDDLVTAQRKLPALTNDVTDAKRQVTEAEDKVSAANEQLTTQVENCEEALLQAQSNRIKAENNLLDFVIHPGMTNLEWQQQDILKSELDIAKKKVADAQTALEDAQAAAQDPDAQTTVQNAQALLRDAQLAVDNAQYALDKGEQDVQDAQSKLKDEQALSPVIKAPFDGFVTKINVAGGDEIQKGTVALTVADPNKFEIAILVSEQDISSIALNGDATVQIDALGVTLPAKITEISPTATISQGVVNYSVTVEVQSLQPTQSTTGQTQTSQQGAPSTMTAADLQSRLQQAVANGQMTQEQADKILSNIQSGQMPQFPGGQQTTTSTTSSSPQNITLKQGLSATVTIIISQKNDVLLVPNRAISKQGKNTVVTVIKDGVTETRTITTGLSDLSNTEVTSGLSEGEQVLVTASSSTSSSSSSQTGEMRIFQGGGPP